ncbi:MAG: glycoside hydrolase family 27 protein [Terracidiphilus sp.]
MRNSFAAAFAAQLLTLSVLICSGQTPSRTVSASGLHAVSSPPMGWNSWDSYGTTVNESRVKANADWMAEHLKAYGWQYITVDMEWFVKNPKPEGNAKDSLYEIDSHGRYQPSIARFPSSANGAGFKPLADYVHSLGLKFGIHILQGIPRTAVKQNLPIAGSKFHAQDAANPDATCKWNYDNYDLKNNAAGQAYYDSLAAMYATWGVDLIKIDCISSGPYKADEIRMISTALAKTGRPIVLSLSPGPTLVEKMTDVEHFATMWRISMDIWDIWHNDKDYPKGLNDQFAKAAAWASAPRNGHYPDADMLPLGYLGPAAGWGDSRWTRLSHDEQETLLSLWGISKSPLIMGGDLPHTDEWTTSLLTNREFIDVDQKGRDPKVVLSNSAEAVWTSMSASEGSYYVAIFNRAESTLSRHFTWSQLGLANGTYLIHDIWKHQDLGTSKSISVTLPPHGCVLYRVSVK